MINILMFLILVSGGIQSEGGYISQVNIDYSQYIHISGELYDVLNIDGKTLYITTEIPDNVQNPFMENGFLYYEVI